jgi:hypothetical protein
MFGYVRPILSQLSPEEREIYQGVYCGLCHAMGARHGFWSRFTLNYDFAFLAILCTEEGQAQWCDRRCPAHPIRKKRPCLGGNSLDAAADASMILTWHKLRDDVSDHSLVRGLPARLISRLFRRAYLRAKAARPDFAAQVEQGMERLGELEQVRSPALDRVADAFASILSGAAPAAEDEKRRRVTEQILYHVGRWIYLVDAWDDLQEDRAQHRYNPLDARFHGQAEREKEYISTTMSHSLNMALSAANLMDFGQWDRVVLHTLCQGLPAVQSAVLDGSWKQLKRAKTGRKNHERPL